MRQEARLCHPRPDQRVASLGGGQVRADRGHPGEVQRDGRQRGRDRGSRARNEGAREEPDDEEESEGKLVEVKPKLPAKSGAKDPAERPGDPVRMYLAMSSWISFRARVKSPSPNATSTFEVPADGHHGCQLEETETSVRRRFLGSSAGEVRKTLEIAKEPLSLEHERRAFAARRTDRAKR